jgi:glycerophosphoryl diester phosphodiesterase
LVTTNRPPLIIGHRGASAVAPENTLSAFARALRDGADGIELDVRLSRDRVPVVLHDATVKHTRMRDPRVAKIPAERLKQVDVGSWFNRCHPELARVQYERQTIATLDDALAFIANQSNRQSIAYVEVKCGRSYRRNDELARATLQVVRKHQEQLEMRIISFNLRAIARMKRLEPSLRTGALFSSRRKILNSAESIIRRATDCGADEVVLHHSLVSGRLIELITRNGLLPVVWTVDDPRWKGRAEKLGIRALITNDPGRMLSHRDGPT